MIHIDHIPRCTGVMAVRYDTQSINKSSHYTTLFANNNNYLSHNNGHYSFTLRVTAVYYIASDTRLHIDHIPCTSYDH